MIRWVLESLYLGQPFRYLGHHHITHRKICEATWSQKVRRKLTKTQKFRESQLALKNKILSFARFPRLSFTSTFRNVMIWCALDSPGLGQSFKYLERYHITHRKNFRATWSQKVRPELMKNSCFWELLRLSKFLNFRQFWAQFLTSGDSKIFSMGEVITLKVFRRLS